MPVRARHPGACLQHEGKPWMPTLVGMAPGTSPRPVPHCSTSGVWPGQARYQRASLSVHGGSTLRASSRMESKSVLIWATMGSISDAEAHFRPGRQLPLCSGTVPELAKPIHPSGLAHCGTIGVLIPNSRSGLGMCCRFELIADVAALVHRIMPRCNRDRSVSETRRFNREKRGTVRRLYPLGSHSSWGRRVCRTAPSLGAVLRSPALRLRPRLPLAAEIGAGGATGEGGACGGTLTLGAGAPRPLPRSAGEVYGCAPTLAHRAPGSAPAHSPPARPARRGCGPGHSPRPARAPGRPAGRAPWPRAVPGTSRPPG
jgi:hypothetical protein